MRVLCEAEAAEYLESQIRHLPETLLNVLSSSGGAAGKGVLIRRVIGTLPEGIRTVEVSDWVDTMLGHFITRGDIERISSTKYAVQPSYAVGMLPDAESSLVRIRLHGDPVNDARLLSRIRDFDPDAWISNSKGDALALTDPPRVVGENPSAASPEVGACEPDMSLVNRTLCINRVQAEENVGETARVFDQVGCALFDLEELAGELPSIHNLVCPADADLKNARSISGLWEEYSEDGSWTPVSDWLDAVHPLVRCSQKDGSEKSRDFYHAGDGRVAEISWEESALWNHYLRYMRGCEGTSVYDGSDLSLPRDLPPSAMNWIGLVVGRRIRVTRGCERLPLPKDVAGRVQAVIGEKLGVRIGKPREQGGNGRGRRR